MIKVGAKAHYLYVMVNEQGVMYMFLADKKHRGYVEVTKEELDIQCELGADVYTGCKYMMDLEKLIEVKAA